MPILTTTGQKSPAAGASLAARGDSLRLVLDQGELKPKLGPASKAMEGPPRWLRVETIVWEGIVEELYEQMTWTELAANPCVHHNRFNAINNPRRTVATRLRWRILLRG